MIWFKVLAGTILVSNFTNGFIPTKQHSTDQIPIQKLFTKKSSITDGFIEDLSPSLAQQKPKNFEKKNWKNLESLADSNIRSAVFENKSNHIVIIESFCSGDETQQLLLRAASDYKYRLSHMGGEPDWFGLVSKMYSLSGNNEQLEYPKIMTREEALILGQGGLNLLLLSATLPLIPGSSLEPGLASVTVPLFLLVTKIVKTETFMGQGKKIADQIVRKSNTLNQDIMLAVPSHLYRYVEQYLSSLEGGKLGQAKTIQELFEYKVREDLSWLTFFGPLTGH